MEMGPLKIVFDVQQSDGGGYEARASAHSIFTQAENLDELRTMVDDAVHCHFGPESSVPIILLKFQK